MVDRISSLPNEVLCHVLSFLSTEQAVKTSLVSKRWRPLWTLVPALDFDHLTISKPSFFERIVYTTIHARDDNQPITRFRLKYKGSDYHHSQADVDVKVWVNIAIQRGIQNLDIEMCQYSVRLGCCIFSCKTLVVLKLTGLSLNAATSVNLPSLKSLHLRGVIFVQPKYLVELFYGCPMLEDLNLDYIMYADHQNDGSVCEEGFKIPNLVRAHLFMVDAFDTNILLKAISNAKFLTIDQPGVHVIPEFPHLRHLIFSSDKQSWKSPLLMLKNCPKLQRFELRCFEFYGSFDAHFAVPECIMSHLKECYLRSYRGTRGDLQFAKYIMQNSTYLRSMKVDCVSHDSLEKHEMLKKLAFCSRKSTSCELSFV